MRAVGTGWNSRARRPGFAVRTLPAQGRPCSGAMDSPCSERVAGLGGGGNPVLFARPQPARCGHADGLFQFAFKMSLTHRTGHCRRRGDESLISFFRVLWTLIRDSSPRLLQWLVSFRGRTGISCVAERPTEGPEPWKARRFRPSFIPEQENEEPLDRAPVEFRLKLIHEPRAVELLLHLVQQHRFVIYDI